MKQILLGTLLLLIWMLMSIVNYAQPVPPQTIPPSLVVDQAGVFTPKQRQFLQNDLIAFNDSTSNQIVVVTLADLEGYPPWEVAYNIGKTWGVGQSGFDNGVVILFKPKTINSRGQVFIAVGYGLEGAIPDATTKLIVEREMIPLFKQDRVYDGIVAGVQVIKDLAIGEYDSKTYTSQGASSVWPSLILFLFLFVFIVQKIARSRAYSIGHDIPFWTAIFLSGATRGHGGSFGDFSSGSGSFGGFSGFGGGGFGGGGAGGSW